MKAAEICRSLVIAALFSVATVESRIAAKDAQRQRNSELALRKASVPTLAVAALRDPPGLAPSFVVSRNHQQRKATP